MKCRYCERDVVNKGALTIHEKHCQENPNRVQRILSPRARAQKGCTPWNKGQVVGRHKRWEEKFSLDQVLVADSTYARHHVKRRILQEELIDYRCSICDIGPEWMNRPMPLILDHENGVNNDNRLENLRFVCSNCDSQLPTYKSKNRKK